MFNNANAGSYIDATGTKSTSMQFTEEDKKLTEILNNSKTVAIMEIQNEQLKRQNDLYEKEIREIRRNGTITMWAAIIGALFGIISTILSIDLIITVVIP